jgi:chromosome segregation ATPase
LAGLYHEVGKRFCESRLTEDLKYGGLQEALAPYYANQKKISALQSDMGKLRKDQEAKWSQLKTLGAHRFHQKRVREIETDIQRIEEQLEDAFEDLGTQHRAMPLTNSQDAEAAGIVDRIREIERVNRRKNKRIDRLNAALGIEFVNRQLGGLAHRIAKLEGDMEARRREIETLRTQASEGEKELQRLRRVRGSKQSLLEDIDDQERGEKS